MVGFVGHASLFVKLLLLLLVELQLTMIVLFGLSGLVSLFLFCCCCFSLLFYSTIFFYFFFKQLAFSSFLFSFSFCFSVVVVAAVT